MAAKAVAHGGEWTNEKLERVRKYLRAYRAIFTANERARHFTTWYVDAFAGTGYRIPKRTEVEEEKLLKGSAIQALEIEQPFDKYLFIEKKRSNVLELSKISDNYPALANRIQFVKGDANIELMKWCQTINWRKNRAVVFLDPFGMEVTWSLLETIANTGGIDLWLLFPLFGINRHLTRRGKPRQEWADRVTQTFGSDEWLDEFYKKESAVTMQGNLFVEEDKTVKSVDIERLSKYFIARLNTIFPNVAPNPLVLRNSGNAALFSLCFASKNSVAVKIAKDILGK